MENLKIARHYRTQMDKRKKLSCQQGDLIFPASPELCNKLKTHLNEVGMLMYDTYTNGYVGFYHGIKIVCDVLQKSCKYYCVSSDSESYREANDSELYAALPKHF